MNNDYSKYFEPYIPPPKSEYQKRIEIKNWLKILNEALQNIKKLGGRIMPKKKKFKGNDYPTYRCPICGSEWLWELDDGTKVYQPPTFYLGDNND